MCWYHPKKLKIRVVFNCGASYQGTSSFIGLDLTRPVSVLVRFRMEHVAIMADIELMFHLVKVHPYDCDLLRFLWWPGGNMMPIWRNSEWLSICLERRHLQVVLAH